MRDLLAVGASRHAIRQDPQLLVTARRPLAVQERDERPNALGERGSDEPRSGLDQPVARESASAPYSVPRPSVIAAHDSMSLINA